MLDLAHLLDFLVDLFGLLISARDDQQIRDERFLTVFRRFPADSQGHRHDHQRELPRARMMTYLARKPRPCLKTVAWGWGCRERHPPVCGDVRVEPPRNEIAVMGARKDA